MIRGDATEQTLFKRIRDLVLAQRIESDADLGTILEAPPPGTDSEILRHLRQMYEAGAWILLESAIADLPVDLRWLFESGAISIEQLAVLHEALGSTSSSDLLAAVQTQSIRQVSGLDEQLEAAIGAALPTLRASVPRIPLGRALEVAAPILQVLRGLSGVEWATPAGSLRRGQETVGDIEIVASTVRPTEVIDELVRMPEVLRCLHRSPRRTYLLLERVQVGVRLPEPDKSAAALLHLTGSAGHVAALRSRASQNGWRLSTDGLYSSAGPLHPAPTEEHIYAVLGLQYIPPEIRDGGDEIDAARLGTLPQLVSRRDIKGDLHMHTTWSDGRDSVEAMVQACRALGYEYVAITDHSQRSAASRNLTIDGIGRQADEIAQARERHPDIAILHGCEVDIMPDGRLDFADSVLERFDIVLASLHERAGHSPDHLLQRYISAMRHPLVAFITHPTNRLVPFRRGYDLDYDRLFETAVETGTLVEIDGAPVHLDMDGPLARRAVAAGVTITLNSDSHRAEVLDRQMDMGVMTARRGWVEARHVLNTRSLADARALLARKHGRSA